MCVPIPLKSLYSVSVDKHVQTVTNQSIPRDAVSVFRRSKNTISDEMNDESEQNTDMPVMISPSVSHKRSKIAPTTKQIESFDEEITTFDEYSDGSEFDGENGDEDRLPDDYEDNLEDRAELQGRRLANSFKDNGLSNLPPIPVLQSGSTPFIERRRFLTWNSIGWITVLCDDEIDNEIIRTIDIGFNDHSAMKPIHFIDYVGYHLGALSKHGAFFASQYKSKNLFKNESSAKLSSLYYLPFSSWAPKSEWRAELEAPEGVSAITCADKYLIVATDLLYVRIYSSGGLQLFLFSIPEPIVSLAAEANILFLIFGRFSDINTQRLSFSIFDLKEQRDIPISNRCLPLSSPDSSHNAIKIRSIVNAGDPVSVVWVGFVDGLSIPSFMDSCGIIRSLFSESGWQWVPILDCYKQFVNISHSDIAASGIKMNLFPIGLDENNILIAIIKGDDPWPVVFPKPPIKELSISPPSPLGRIDLEAEKKYSY